MSLRSGFYQVRLDDGREITCTPRGRLKQRRPDTIRGDIIAMGDMVRVSIQSEESGAIEAVLPRSRELIRMAPSARGEYKQVLLANPDQVVLVFACAQPEPHLRMLDRFLVICERQGIPAIIAANKVDLVGMSVARKMFAIYEKLGYTVIYTTAAEGLGVDALREHLTGKLSGLVGPSGVGKSSLLNSVQPALGLAVSHVSESTSKGRHTTVTRSLFPLNGGGFVADLPGIRMLALWDIEPEELDAYFPELRERVADCQFSNCTHSSEPDCAVKAAVAAGEVDQVRYDSYLKMRFGEEEDWGVVLEE
ncbi:MAG: ribosome small subunit-dependent GTPase A [Chloroflexi bacterium HGW-Chloroflexi-10]|nr:MAG: ribosome small subunit-dependent GTPase A [Chloroflexi bacterium HGW-Chloroflexi-10]